MGRGRSGAHGVDRSAAGGRHGSGASGIGGAGRARWQRLGAGSPRTAGRWRPCRWSHRWRTCCCLPPRAGRRRRRPAWRCLLQERGLGGRGEDLAARLERWDRERGGRAEASRKLAAALGCERRKRLKLSQAVRPRRSLKLPFGVLLAEAFPRPHRPRTVQRRRGVGSRPAAAATGSIRHHRLPARRVAGDRRCAGRAQGRADHRGSRRSRKRTLTRHLAHRIAARHSLRMEQRGSPRRGAAGAAAGRSCACPRARSAPPDPDAVAALLIETLRAEGLGLLPLGAGATALLERARYAGLDEACAGLACWPMQRHWLGPLLNGRRDCPDRAGQAPRCAARPARLERAGRARPAGAARVHARLPGTQPCDRLRTRRRPGGGTARAGAVRARPASR